ncbi:MAG: PKD domain-containing protein [Ferruginibacter sp.]
MKKNLPWLFLKTTVTALFITPLILVSCTTFVQNSSEEEDGPRETLERDIEMMKDPSLGYVPTQQLIKAKEYRDNLWQTQTNAAISGVNWRQLGPKNQGGRTRSILVDANDATGNTVWIGSVGGGLWKTTDITATSPNWLPIDDFFANLAITSIAQDPSNAQIMYFCTGEQGYGNGDAIRGLGVWKTTDGGVSWAQLASTTGATFYYCQKITVNSAGNILVATATGGLQRSANGGTTFTKVLGTGLGITGAANNFCYDVDIAANNDVYATLSGSIHKSTDAGVTFAAAQTIPIAADRIELACAPSDANYVYALIENSNVVAGILRSTNGGTSWISRTEPADADGGIPAADFSRGQAWYDLTIAVDPNTRDALFVGGVDIFRSADGAGTWSQTTHWYGGFGFQDVHADQHFILFKPGSSTIAYFSNDGGIYRSTNANVTTPALTNKGTNYITAQFYSCAIYPTALSTYFLAGAQDNGSHQFTQGTVQNTTQVTGGDGAFVHIDQNEPQYQFTSYVNNNYYRSVDGGSTWTSVTTTNGSFINPTDYDDVGNRMYISNTSNTYKVWDNAQTGNTFNTFAVAGFGGTVTAVKVSPNTANRVFFGANGDVFRVDNANTAPSVTPISTGLPTAYLNCIEVQTGDDNHLLATYTNFGVNSIWESTDGGASWISVEGNLPDMPVRWALFNPNNSDQAVIATELGVWSTDNLNGGATVWGASNSGLANVRVDMLQLRTSDNLMIAATHGRGLFSSDIFTAPTALFTADRLIAYQGVPINFTSTSYNGTSWSWNFGDAGTSISENPAHAYTTPGQFSVTLTLNSGASTLTKNLFIQILPKRGTPYTPADGGNFETNVLDFGADNVSGTGWQRGSSLVAGKSSTTSGSSAWVTGLTGNYVDNSDASLMTPNYNFSTLGGYTLRFQSKRITETAYDGFRVEYTLDSGINWLPLGTAVQAGWYNFANTVGDAAFPVNEAFFAGSASAYTLYLYDLNFLGGNASVAFRIRFKSDGGVTAAGVAIDDFEITGAFNASLAVNLINFTAIQKNNDGLLNWRTENETGITNYTIERSYTGTGFTPVGTLPGKNNTSNNYNYTDINAMSNPGNASYVFYRLKITDNTGKVKYSEIARIALSKSPQVTVGPSPFINYVSVYANEAIKNIWVYNMEGKLVYATSNINGNKIFFDKKMAAGMYLFKIETANGTITRKLQKAE